MLDQNNKHPKEEATKTILTDFTRASQEIEASAVISLDGLIIGAVLNNSIDKNRFAAMCASLLALAEQASNEISRGELKQLLLIATKGIMLLIHIGGNAVLAVSAKSTVNIGRVLVDSKRVASKLVMVLDS